MIINFCFFQSYILGCSLSKLVLFHVREYRSSISTFKGSERPYVVLLKRKQWSIITLAILKLYMQWRSSWISECSWEERADICMYVGMEGWQEWKGLGGWYQAEWRSTHTWWALEPQFGLAAAAYITSIQALHIHHKSSTWAEMGKRNKVPVGRSMGFKILLILTIWESFYSVFRGKILGQINRIGW